MDIIGSNVQINLGVKAQKKGLQDLEDQLWRINAMLRSVSRKEYKIDIKINKSSVATIRELAKSINVLDDAGITGSKSPLAAFRESVKRDVGIIEKDMERLRVMSQGGFKTDTAKDRLRHPSPGAEFPRLGQLSESAKSTPLYDEEGNVSGEKTLETQREVYQAIEGSLVKQMTVISKIVEESGERNRISREVLKTQTNIADQIARQSVKADMMKQLNEKKKIAEIDKNRALTEQKINDVKRLGYTHLKTDLKEQILAGEKITTTTSQWVKQFKDGRIAVWHINEATGEFNQKMQKSVEATMRQRHEDAKALKSIQARTALEERLAKIRESQAMLNRMRLAGWENVKPPKKHTEEIAGQRVSWKSYDLRRDVGNGREEVTKFNEAIGKTAVELKTTEKAAASLKAGLREMKRGMEEIRKTRSIAEARALFDQRTQEGGFRHGDSTKYYDAVKRQSGEIVSAFRWQREGLARYNVEIIKFNTLTGMMTGETKRGAAAAKFLGDTMFRAGEKVFIWTAATTAIFTTIRMIKGLLNSIVQLEANTIFLARVSDRLVTGIENETESFRRKLDIAERVTAATIELTQAIGGSAEEAQKAAAVFLRAGIQEKEVIYGVTAALLASKIAELEVSEAAEMMVSAIRQFNIEATELLPTLDTLNSLSNNWKVSTDDLLQSISRAGSVFASHNGTISELAAMTAVVGQRTSRTGTQIGNAFKTIESRMDRIENTKIIFQELGVSTTKFDGEARSLMQTVLELSVRLDQLSAAEQKELTVQIAGVRQRNILVAALAEADTAFVALNRSMEESGSAYAEFTESSKTLNSALARFKANLVAIADDTRGTLGFLLTGLVNIANAILRVTDAMGSFPVVGALVFGSFFLIRMILGKIIIHMGLLTKEQLAVKLSGSSLSLMLQKQAALWNTLTASITANTRSMGLWRGMAASASGALVPFLTMGNVLTLILSGLVVATSLYSSAQASSVSTLEEYTTLIDMTISKENKRIESIMLTNKALNLLYTEMYRVNRTYKSGQIDFDSYTKSMDKLKASAKKIANSMNIEIESDIESGESQSNLREQLQARLDEAFGGYREALKRNVDMSKSDLNKALKDLREAEAAFDPSLQKAAAVNLKLSGPELTPWGLGMTSWEKDLEKETGSWQITPENVNAAERLYSNQLQKIKERQAKGDWRSHDPMRETSLKALIEHTRELSVNYNTAKSEVDKLNEGLTKQQELLENTRDLEDPEKQKQYADAVNTVSALTNQTEVYLDKLKKVDKIRKASGLKKTYAEVGMELRNVNSLIDATANEMLKIQEIHKGITDKEMEEWIKQLDQAKDKAIELSLVFIEMKRKQIGGFFESSLGGRTTIEDSLSQNRLKRTQATRDTMSQIKKLQEDMLQTEVSRSRVKEYMKKAKEFEGADEVETNAVRVAYRNKAQEEMNRLKDLEIAKTTRIFEAETAILEAKRQQTKEALRAIGQLDEEAKLRLLAQAQYFQENPEKKIGAEDLFYGSSASAGTLNQFYNSRMMSPEEETSPFANFLMGTGIGLTAETVNAQSDLDNLRNGQSEIDIANRGQRNAEDYDRQGRFIGGDDTLWNAGVPRVGGIEDRGLGANGNPVELTIQPDAFDLSPLTEKFEEFLTVTATAELERFKNEVIDMIENKRKPRVGRPRN